MDEGKDVAHLELPTKRHRRLFPLLAETRPARRLPERSRPTPLLSHDNLTK